MRSGHFRNRRAFCGTVVRCQEVLGSPEAGSLPVCGSKIRTPDHECECRAVPDRNFSCCVCFPYHSLQDTRVCGGAVVAGGGRRPASCFVGHMEASGRERKRAHLLLVWSGLALYICTTSRHATAASRNKIERIKYIHASTFSSGIPSVCSSRHHPPLFRVGGGALG